MSRQALRLLFLVGGDRGSSGKGLGTIEHRSRLLETAERFQLQALSIVSKLRHPWATAEIRRDMGLLYLDMGRRDEARKAFAAAEKALLKLGSVPRAEAMRAQAERAASSRP